jgi:hypothetical protein
MTDTRSRHVPCYSPCSHCNALWPCRHTSERDRADAAEAALSVARADAERLALHLRNAIHDLIGDTLEDGWWSNYEEAAAALAAHEALVSPPPNSDQTHD